MSDKDDKKPVFPKPPLHPRHNDYPDSRPINEQTEPVKTWNIKANDEDTTKKK